MDDCIFCQVIAGKSPSYKIYEDDLFVGILDIFPTTRGHSLLLSKKHFKWVHEVPEFGHYWETALKLEKAIEKALKPKWVQYITHGLIPHAHIHVLPRYDDVGSGFFPREKIIKPSDEEMKKIAAAIKKHI